MLGQCSTYCRGPDKNLNPADVVSHGTNECPAAPSVTRAGPWSAIGDLTNKLQESKGVGSDPMVRASI